LASRRITLASVAQLFDSLNYRSVLARGYALVRDAEGRPIRTVKAVGEGEALTIELADGRVDATAGRPPRPRVARPRTAAQDQGALF
jgi:exodeoxyribonuclease VII large subunit